MRPHALLHLSPPASSQPHKPGEPPPQLLRLGLLRRQVVRLAELLHLRLQVIEAHPSACRSGCLLGVPFWASSHVRSPAQWMRLLALVATLSTRASLGRHALHACRTAPHRRRPCPGRRCPLRLALGRSPRRPTHCVPYQERRRKKTEFQNMKKQIQKSMEARSVPAAPPPSPSTMLLICRPSAGKQPQRSDQPAQQQVGGQVGRADVSRAAGDCRDHAVGGEP